MLLFPAQLISQADVSKDPGECFGPHPYPSASGMLRDPEQECLYLVEVPAGEGKRISKIRASGKKHPLALIFADSLKIVCIHVRT
jgi:hypothetical protein